MLTFRRPKWDKRIKASLAVLVKCLPSMHEVHFQYHSQTYTHTQRGVEEEQERKEGERVRDE